MKKIAATEQFDRYDSVDDLAEDIRRFLREKDPVSAWPDPPTAKLSVGCIITKHSRFPLWLHSSLLHW